MVTQVIEIGSWGIYHAWMADVPAIRVAAGIPINGEATDNIVIFSGGFGGSGLAGTVDQRHNVKRGVQAGDWEPGV